MTSGSASRPFPIHPQARYPSPGSTNLTPRAASTSILRRTASCANISEFIAGARSTAARVAVYSVDRKSSAIPFASLPMMLAVAGAMSRRSIDDASAMCSMSALAPGSNCPVMTRRFVIASKVSAPTNWVAEAVMIATTSCPRFCSPRATSTALYAPIPPVTPSAINMTSFALGFADLLDGLGEHLLLGDGHFLVHAWRHLGRRPGQELPGPRAGRHHELERIRQLDAINHGVS